jgi:hypothetical protein
VHPQYWEPHPLTIVFRVIDKLPIRHFLAYQYILRTARQPGPPQAAAVRA